MNEESKFALPAEIVGKMLEHDHFSKWLGLTIEESSVGYCRLHYIVKKEMLNGFSSIHGGAVFAASDSAFAFACNSHGNITVALDVSISFTRPASEGDKLTVEAREVYRGRKTGVYDVRTTNSAGELVALFKGTAYITSAKFDS